jgi:glycosyltransferase involved in cell wall biosynthesis
MAHTRPRVLWVGEAHYLASGFGTYSLELLERMHHSGRYEVMELASYAGHHDDRNSPPWRFMAATANPDDPEEVAAYRADPINEFGQWRFDQACVEFQPDIVLSARDPWMDEFIERSPFRPYYRWVFAPTVDAIPLREGWVANFLDADVLLAYSDWGADVLRSVTGGLGNVLGPAPPGADLTAFRPVADRRAHRQSMGMDPDCLVLGTTMRNQMRKLYPELLRAFAHFLRTAPEALARKSYLYCHTAWPDVGWDLPCLLKEVGLGSRVLFTYACKDCGECFPSFFHDSVAYCPRCGKATATMPGVHSGISRANLGRIYNLFDVYVQYANMEGFGMPQVEAAACGIPVMSVDYAAMSDVVRKLHGWPIRVLFHHRESSTHRLLAIPDQDHFVEGLVHFFSMPWPVRAHRGHKGRRAVEEHYTWDRTFARWEGAMQALSLLDRQETWRSPPRYHSYPEAPPRPMDDEEFVRWCICDVAGRPDLDGSYLTMRLVRDIGWGATFAIGGYVQEDSILGERRKPTPFGRKEAYLLCKDMADRRNKWEAIRARAGR